MAHVELSVSEPFAPGTIAATATSSLAHWAPAVASATEACLIIDRRSMIVSASASACTLLGFATQADAQGRYLFDGMLRLLDFTSAGAPLPDGEVEKIPPVLACRSSRLARGLLRVQSGPDIRTVDAIATPLFDMRKVVGSLTFFSQI